MSRAFEHHGRRAESSAAVPEVRGGEEVASVLKATTGRRWPPACLPLLFARA